MLDQVHSALVDVGNRLYLKTKDPSLIRETFTANEENRAATLRNLLWGASKAGAKADVLLSQQLADYPVCCQRETSWVITRSTCVCL